ncbi:MAG: response regulator [Magnetococcales bacterium]|nr:response regulator [Magnetococcales bacterium]
MNQPEKHATLLIVDDMPANIKVLVQSLHAKYRIIVATNGPGALERAQSEKPDLILLDIMMPGMDGYEVCKKLKANEQLRDIPVIFITARDEEEDEAKGLELGAVDYITKPFSIAIVLARIHTQLQIRALNRDLAKSLKLIRSTFGRYISEDVVASILDTPDGLRMGGERKEVTVLMSDLRGFTLLSEHHLPEEVFSALNMYLEMMTTIILKHQGTIIEFIGDGILAIFGTPMRQQDDPQRAVACALEMQLAMPQVNEKNRNAGFPEFMMGVGLNTGHVIAGNIGSYQRTKYGVVGSTINLASRIESLTVGGQVLVSEATARACGPVLAISQSWPVMPKGVGRPITIHEVTGIAEPYSIHLPHKKKIDVQPIDNPVPVIIHIMEGKSAIQTSSEGRLTGVSLPLATIASNMGVERLTNLQVDLFNPHGVSITNPLYCKVVTEDDGDGTMTVHFTSVPQEAEMFLQRLKGTNSALIAT